MIIYPEDSHFSAESSYDTFFYRTTKDFVSNFFLVLLSDWTILVKYERYVCRKLAREMYYFVNFECFG